jgi:hypothetical protein
VTIRISLRADVGVGAMGTVRQRDKWVDGMPVIMRTWFWLTPTSDWSRAMRGLESVCRRTPARCPLFEPGLSTAWDAPA